LPAGADQVVVVGGGPAGCAAAHALSETGWPVLLLERGTPGRDKACGDLFLPPAVAQLALLGLGPPALGKIGRPTSPHLELARPAGGLWRMAFTGGPAWMLPRRLLDEALRTALPPGVTVAHGATATRLQSGADGVLAVTVHRLRAVATTVLAPAVVLACGPGGTLPSEFGISGAPLLAPALSAYVVTGPVPAPVFELADDCRPGYRWRFPLGDGVANVGVCWLARAPGSLVKASAISLLRDHHIAPPVAWRGGLGALWSGSGSRWHHPAGIVSCGDAAGLVNPFTGEGLTAALVSGRAAGAAVGQFLRHPRAQVHLEDYSLRVGQLFTAAYTGSAGFGLWKQLCGLGRG